MALPHTFFKKIQEEKLISPKFEWKQSLLCENTGVFLDDARNIWEQNENNNLQINPYLKNIKKILGGCDSSYFFADDKNQVWTIGCSYYGQLGIGKIMTASYEENSEEWNKQREKVAITKPAIIPNLKANEIKELIQTSKQATFILKTDGSLLVCGRNDYGQLGLRHNKPCAEFTSIPDLKNVEHIYSFWDRTFFKLSNGIILTCGNTDSSFNFASNEISKKDFYLIPTEIFSGDKIKNIIQKKYGTMLYLTKENEVLISGSIPKGLIKEDKQYTDTPLKTILKNITDIQCGWSCLYFLRNDGKVLALGKPKHESLSGHYSELTIIPNLENITQLRVYYLSHIVALDKNGQAYTTKIDSSSNQNKTTLKLKG